MQRKTKIIATLGPASCNAAQIRGLLAAGADVVRLNGSHNTCEWFAEVIRTVRHIDPLVPILLDLPGRKVRTGVLSNDVRVRKGTVLTFTTARSDKAGVKVPVTHRALHQELRRGNVVLADDGRLKFEVVDVRGRDIICRVHTEGMLRSSKGLNIPYVKLHGPVVTERDRELLHFARAQDIDFVGVSFVESAQHVEEVRKVLAGTALGIIAKIETQAGLDHMREIIAAADGSMIDRGDLSAETEIESLALMQKRILSEAQLHAKPVIVATEILHSMIHSPHATKAEISDISAAVLDGASALMLSGETAVGDFPREAIGLLSRVCAAVEKEAPCAPPIVWHAQRSLAKPVLAARAVRSAASAEEIPHAIGSAIREVCLRLPVSKVICLTMSGFAPRMISKYRLPQPIIGVTNSATVARQLRLSRGVQPLLLDLKFRRRSADHIIQSLQQLYERQVVSSKDLIVVTAVKHPHTGNKMNTLEIYAVKDLIASQGWRKSAARGPWPVVVRAT